MLKSAAQVKKESQKDVLIASPSTSSRTSKRGKTPSEISLSSSDEEERKRKRAPSTRPRSHSVEISGFYVKSILKNLEVQNLPF